MPLARTPKTRPTTAVLKRNKLIAAGLYIMLVALILGSVNVRPAQAASFIVNSTDDEVDANIGDGVCQTVTSGECTLRAAIQEANALAGDDDITVPLGQYVLTLGSSGEDSAAGGDLDITSNITITGAAASSTTIDGNNIDRVFHVVSGSLSLRSLTIRNGNPGSSANGGAVFSSGTLVIGNGTPGGNVVITTNSASSGGGVHVAGGSANITFSTLANNSATGGTGGGLNVAGGSAAVTTSTLSGNSASHGTSGAGGGAYVAGGASLTLNNSTVSGNLASGSSVTAGGGGVFAGGTANLNSATVVNNTALQAGGGVLQLGGSVNLRNTIIANNTGPSPDCSGTLNSLGYNLLESSGGCNGLINNVNGDRVGSDPNLDVLDNNGGPTFTHELLAGSLAIDAGNPGGCGDGGSAFSTDQRGPGFIRNQNLRCDIGAYEYVPGTQTPTVTPTITLTPSVTPTFTASFTPSTTSSPQPSATPTGTLTPTLTPSGTPTLTPSSTSAPKFPLFTAPAAATIDFTATSAANFTQTAQVATAIALVPSATSDSGQALTLTAFASESPTATMTTGPTSTATATFAFPPETGVLSVAQSVGRAGGSFQCGIWLIEAGQGAVPEGSALRCNTIAAAEALAGLPDQARGFWQVLDIRIEASNGQSIAAFTQPISVCAYYKPEYLEAVGNDAGRFAVYTSSEGAKWEEPPTELDEAAGRICAIVTHFSLFRLAGKPAEATGGLAGTIQSWFTGGIVGVVAIACGLLLLVVVVVVVIALMRRGKAKEPEPAT